jgi:hypothetical protein
MVSLKAGAYTFTATTPEFDTVTGNLTATFGVTHCVEILLQRAVNKAIV